MFRRLSRGAPLIAFVALVLILWGDSWARWRVAASQGPHVTPATGATAAPGGPEGLEAERAPTLILLSFDGWRWDYERQAPAPNLQRLIARGVRAERLIPSYPSKTFPNHYTLVTGLYPGHHGIVANMMYDPAMKAGFSLSNRTAVGDGRWWGGEPIWVTAQRRGEIAATLYWPGSEAEIGGVRPRYWSLYDNATAPPNDVRVDRLLAWLDLPVAERPTFITGYFSDTDVAGHDAGPNSPEVRDAIVRLDAVLGRLMAGLEARGLLDRVNLVLTSDHGMAETSPDRVIVLEDYLDLSTVTLLDTNPTIGVLPKTVSVDELYRRLRKAHPHLRVYRKERSPARWHYRDHPRVPPIVGVADDGWVVLRQRPKAGEGKKGVGGAHGYDPKDLSMSGLFVAAGPSFRRGVTVKPFENVHVYNALAAALRLPPAPNDGDPSVARRLLAPGVPLLSPARTPAPAPTSAGAADGASGRARAGTLDRATRRDARGDAGVAAVPVWSLDRTR